VCYPRVHGTESQHPRSGPPVSSGCGTELLLKYRFLSFFMLEKRQSTFLLGIVRGKLLGNVENHYKS
jgi:hypothetical protein